MQVEIKAIVFDLDGTLIDSGADLAASVNFALDKVGFAARSAQEVERFVGDGVRKLMERALETEENNMVETALAIFMDHYGKHCTDRTVLYPEVAEVLAVLAPNYQLAVLTNKSEAFTEKIIRHLRVDHYFQEVIAGDTLSVKKPAPDGLLLLAETWGLAMTQLLMVGDHVTDILTGINAGCKTVFVEGGIGVRGDMPPDRIIRSMGELPELLLQ